VTSYGFKHIALDYFNPALSLTLRRWY